MKRRRKKKKTVRKRRGKSRTGLWIGLASFLAVTGAGLAYVLMKPDAAPAVVGPQNILLVTIDAIRADRVGCYGFDAAKTPTLDGLAAAGGRYENCYAPSPVVRVSHASILTGLYPFYHGLRGGMDAGLTDTAVTLAEALREAGYATAAFVGSGVLHARYGLAQGFDLYSGELSATSLTGRDQFAERVSSAVTDAALDWYSDAPRDKPVFVWVHFADPTYPYSPPGYRPSGTDASPYELEIAAVDTQLGRLLRLVEERDATVRRTTLVVVAGSCGEALFDHGEPTHGLFVYDEALHVPLIVSGSAAITPGATISSRVSLVDVFPSVLAWLNVPPGRNVNGRILPVDGTGADVPVYFESRFPFVEYGWSPLEGLIVGSRKLVAGPNPELFDLAADAREARNRYELDRSEAAELERTLAQLKQNALGYPRLEPMPVEPESNDPAFRAAASAGQSAGALADPKERIAIHRQMFDARAKFAANQPAEAVALLRDVLTKDPGNRRAIAMVLRQVESEALRADALDVLRQRIDASPLEAPFDLLVSRRLGIAALEAGQPREAERRLSQAVAVNANDPSTLYHLARALEATSTGDPMPHFQKAFELEPANTEYALALADRLETAGQYSEAISVYDRVLTSAPDDPDVLAASSWAMYKAGADKSVALERARRASSLKPGMPKYQHALAVTLIWNESNDEALELLKMAVSADMNYAVGLLKKYEAQREYELIGTLYDLLLADHPENAGLLNNSAWSDYSLRRRPDRALERAQRAVQLSPNVPPFRVTLAAILIWQERPADALPHLQHALRVDTRHGSAHYYMGVLLQASGDASGAVTAFRNAIANAGEPPAVWVEDARKRLNELQGVGGS